MYFKYKALNNEGKTVKSYIEAENEKQAFKIIKKLNLNLISINPVKSIKKERIKPRDILIFTRLFSRLVKSHISIIESLKIILQNIDNPGFKNIINNIMGYIERGDSLSKALERYKYVFTPFYCAVVKAGESSGKMDLTLELLFQYIQTSQSTKKKFQSALFYPIFVLIMAVIILSLIFIFVVPQFRDLFSMFDRPLPALTLFFFGLSFFIKGNFILILIFLAGIGALIYLFLKTSKGKRYWDRIVFKIPIAGQLLRESLYTKFCQILSLLVQSHVNILLSFEILAEIMGNTLVKEKIIQVREQVKNGRSITEAFISAHFFPTTIVQMVKAGEESGELDKMLESAARFYEENLSLRIEIFASVLQPALIIVIGLFIAVIILSIFMPIFQLGSIIK